MKKEQSKPFIIQRPVEGVLLTKRTKNKVEKAELKGKLYRFSKEFIRDLREEIAKKKRDYIFKVKHQGKLIKRICEEYDEMFQGYRDRYSFLTEKILLSTLAYYPCKVTPLTPL